MHSYGKRAPGSDGSDHIHREKIASQYKISASYKQKLKALVVLNAISCSVIICHLLQVKANISLTRQVLPAVELWEYIYLCTIGVSLLGWMSLPRNKSNILTAYIFCNAMFSVAPLFVAAFLHVPELSDLLMHRRANMHLFGQPCALVLYSFLTLAGVVNTCAIFCASKLVQAWRMKGFKSR